MATAAAEDKEKEKAASIGQVLEYYSRISIYAVSATAAFLVSSLVAAPVAYIVGQRQKANDVVTSLLSLTSFLCGIGFDIQGLEYLDPQINEGQRVFVANHQASLDVLALGKVFPQSTYIMAKHTLAYAPFLGWFLALAGHFFVRRKDHIAKAQEDASVAEKEHAAAMATMSSIVARMKREKVGVFVFPEGTRAHSPTPLLLPFKKGAFRLAIETGSPIIPIVVSNYSNLYDTRAKRFKSGTIKVRILPPVEIKGMSADDVDRVVEETRSKMQKVYQEISPIMAKL